MSQSHYILISHVEVFDQYIFKGEALVLVFLELLEGSLQLRKRVAGSYRHDLPALFLYCTVQGDCKAYLQGGLCKHLYAGNHAAGGYSHAPGTKAYGILIIKNRDGFEQVIDVVKRFAHSHEYYVGEFSGKLLAYKELLKDLAACKVPLEAHVGSAAEGASHLASHLG